MRSKQQVALLLINHEALVPTEISRKAALEVGKLEPRKFAIGWSAKRQRRNPGQRKALRNYYRHFKEDLTLNKKQLRGPDDGAWKMKTRRTDDDKPRGNLGELIQQDPRAYFSALQATEVFLYHIVREAVNRVRNLFDDGVSIHVHFTAPAFQDKDKDSSARYRGYLREITERLSEQSLFNDITFKTGGDDFLYEPYGVWYYFAIVEQAIARRSEAAGKTFLVFDMGGSTTDFALVQVNRQAGSFKLYPLCSSIECAGEYFDRFVLKTLLNAERLPTQSQRWSETLEEIEAAKIALCTGQADKATIEIDGEKHVLTRDRLEEILHELWSDVNRPLGPGFRGFLQQALKEAKDNPQFLEFDMIERVFLAGGSTELPGIQALIYEDLQRLALVNSKDHLFVVPHRIMRKGGGIVPRSCLAALGQAGEMAEVAGASDDQEDTFVLDRAEYLYAQVTDDQSTTYTFPRRHVKRSGPVPQDETFLFGIGEVRGQNRARFDETDGGLPVYEPYDGVTKLPKRFDFYFRNNLEDDYPEDPHINLITKLGLEKANSGQGDGAGRPEHLLRFSCDAQHFDGELKVKPYLRRQNGKIWQRVHQDAGSVRVSLRPPSVVSENPEQPDEPVHVCIDLGMNNTALAIYAPGRVFPERAEEIEIFTLGERSEPDKGESAEQDTESPEEPKGEMSAADDQPIEEDEDMNEQVTETNGTPPRPIVPPSAPDHLTWVAEMIRWVDSVTQRGEAGGNQEQASRVISQLGDVASSLRDTTEQLKRIADQRQRGKFVNPDEAIADLIEAGASPVTQPTNEDLSYEAFQAFIESHKEGIIFDESILRQIWARCMGDEGQLVVLAGPPGSGKTTLVRLLAEFFNRGIDANAFPPGWEAFYLLQPVSPSWFSPANLLGSVSPLDGQFRETAFLRFLLKAEAHHYYVAEGNASRRFFACLDEFNIAQPEQYLADLLSKLEAPPGSEARKLTLCEGRDIGRDDPWTLELTPNVKLFATLNTDVSTKTLSPKVLDRCFFLRLTPTFDDLKVAALRFVEKEKDKDLTSFHEYFRPILESVDALGRKANTPVGFRSIKQAYDYVAKHPLASDLSADGVLSQLADEVLCSFFLSKLPGAYAVNNPEYEKALSDDKSLLRKHPEATRILDRIGEGFPGQAVL